MVAHLLNVSAQAEPRDTVVFVAARDGFDVIIAVAAAFVALTFLAVLVALVILFVQARAAVKAIDRVRKGVSMDPAVESLRRTAGHVEGIADTVRQESDRVTRAAGTFSDRLTQVSERMEERIEEFNALMEVVQIEAEHAFVDTAATARGVRRSLGELGASGRGSARASRTRPLPEPDGRRSPAAGDTARPEIGAPGAPAGPSGAGAAPPEEGAAPEAPPAPPGRVANPPGSGGRAEHDG